MEYPVFQGLRSVYFLICFSLFRLSSVAILSAHCHISEELDTVTLNLTALEKNSRPHHLRSSLNLRASGPPGLELASVLTFYLDMTSSLRKKVSFSCSGFTKIFGKDYFQIRLFQIRFFRIRFFPLRFFKIRFIISLFFQCQSITGSRPATLFIFRRSPYTSVKSSTLARLFVEAMAASGVDTDRYKSQSARSSVCAAQRTAGARLKTILRLGRWRSKSVYKKHYEKDLENISAEGDSSDSP